MKQEIKSAFQLFLSFQIHQSRECKQIKGEIKKI